MQEHINVIYKHTSQITGKSYIGLSTEGIEERFRRHLSSTNHSSNNHFHNAIRKYGSDTWDSDVLFVAFDKEYLNEAEIALIAEYDTYNNGYNSTLGGDTTFGWKPTDENKRNISNSLKGRKLTEEHKKKVSDALSGEKNPMYGKTHTDEAKRKISNQSKLLVHTDEAKRKISEANKGKVTSDETKKKISEAKIGKSLGPQAEETKRKISDAHKGKKFTDAHKAKMSANSSGENNAMFGQLHNEETKRKMKEAHAALAKVKADCPYCGKEVVKARMNRWHGENCKFKK